MAIITLLLSIVIGALLSSSFGAVCEFILLLVINLLIIAFFCSHDNYARTMNVFATLMGCYFVYACFCHAYRMANGYTFFGSFDGLRYYIPQTIRLLNFEDITDVIRAIYSDDSTLPLKHGGSIFVYFYLIGKFAVWANVDIFFAIQISLMPFAAMMCAVQYNLLLRFGLPRNSAYKWSIIFGLCSALFWLSSFVVRDLPISLAYSIAIYQIFSSAPFLRRLLWGCLSAAVVLTLRLASSLALVPIVLLAVFRNSERKSVRYGLLGMFLAAVIVFGGGDIFVDELLSKQQGYLGIELRDQGGNSLLSAFNDLPFGVSHVAKTIYAQFHPIPAWRNMITNSEDVIAKSAYNIARFPDLWVVFFRITGMLILIYGCLKHSIREKLFENKPLMYSFNYALLLLILQSTTIEERRKLGVYPLLFLVIVLCWERTPPMTRRRILLLSAFLFVLLQILGLSKL